MVIPAAPDTADALLLAGAIVLGGLLSEDGATITAATLTASCSINPKLAFLSAFIGLWAGDFGVYVLARTVGPAILQNSTFQRWFGKASRAAGDRAAGDGRWSLALSRFFPGTRVPAYISAGLGRMPAAVFAAITAASALAWVILVFAAIQLAPAQVGPAKQKLSILGLFGLGLLVLLHLWKRRGLAVRKQVAIAFARMSKWEFWPAWLFYAPVGAMCVWLGIRYRGLSLPAVANINQKNGGIIGESKIAILQELMRTSPEFTADAYPVGEGPTGKRLGAIETICARERIRFPAVLKPDVAQRGAGFRMIHSFLDAAEYLSRVSAPLVLQRYVEGPKEAGIFYYRFPNEKRGHIFGITRKRFPVVTGDGRKTIRELIDQDSRARLLVNTYLARLASKSNHVLSSGERLRLVEAGNHCQGCIFMDGWDLYSEELRSTVDAISQNLRGFYIGRYDVRYRNDEDLRAGRGFTILELNGASSEATNIYDERNSLWSAYSTLYRQWSLVYEIGAMNRARGYRPATPLTIFKDWCEFSRRAIEYPAAD
jgi:membrane protein DedA with SNARE-associated domain